MSLQTIGLAAAEAMDDVPEDARVLAVAVIVLHDGGEGDALVNYRFNRQDGEALAAAVGQYMLAATAFGVARDQMRPS